MKKKVVPLPLSPLRAAIVGLALIRESIAGATCEDRKLAMERLEALIATRP